MPDRLGNYEILEVLGDGAEGRVYKARCIAEGVSGVAVGELVALKRLKHTGHSKESRLFQRQTEILSQLKHPSIVAYKDSFVWREDELDEEVYCLVTELLEGETLKEMIEKNSKGIPWASSRSLLEQTLSALEYASGGQRPVVHRDLKLSNIYVTHQGAAKLIDFGIARPQDSNDTTTSAAGFQGTWDYMAPDFTHLQGNFRGDEQSDIFSFGVCLYQVLTGQLPYPKLGENPQIPYFQRWMTPNKLPEADYRHPIFSVLRHARSCIEKCIAYDRTLRHRTFKEVLADFNRIEPRKLTHGADVYEYIEYLGKGGFGKVFRARRLRDSADTAIKEMLADKQASRFVREAKILQKLAHPNLVQYLDFIEVTEQRLSDARRLFLVLEYLPGMPASCLKDRIKASGAGLDPVEVLKLFIGYLDCLEHLHHQEIIHRDIKPGNLYAPEGHPENAKVFDLGIAHDDEGTKTHGQVPGTLDYMPPEFAQQSHGRGSAQSDIYSIGVTLYQALAAKLPFPRFPMSEGEAWQMFFLRSEQPPECTFEHAVFKKHPELVTMLRKALALKPDQRQKSAKALADEMRGLLRQWELAETKVEYDAAIKAAQSALNKADYDTAQRHVERALKLRDKDPVAAELLKLVCRERDSAKAYKEAMDLARIVFDKKDYDEAERQAKVALQCRANDRAATELLFRAKSARDNQAAYQTALASAQQALGKKQFDPAEKHVNQALKSRPGDKTATDLLAQIQKSRQEFDAEMEESVTSATVTDGPPAEDATRATLPASPITMEKIKEAKPEAAKPGPPKPEKPIPPPKPRPVPLTEEETQPPNLPKKRGLAPWQIAALVILPLLIVAGILKFALLKNEKTVVQNPVVAPVTVTQTQAAVTPPPPIKTLAITLQTTTPAEAKIKSGHEITWTFVVQPGSTSTVPLIVTNLNQNPELIAEPITQENLGDGKYKIIAHSLPGKTGNAEIAVQAGNVDSSTNLNLDFEIIAIPPPTLELTTSAPLILRSNSSILPLAFTMSDEVVSPTNLVLSARMEPELLQVEVQTSAVSLHRLTPTKGKAKLMVTVAAAERSATTTNDIIIEPLQPALIRLGPTNHTTDLAGLAWRLPCWVSDPQHLNMQSQSSDSRLLPTNNIVFEPNAQTGPTNGFLVLTPTPGFFGIADIALSLTAPESAPVNLYLHLVAKGETTLPELHSTLTDFSLEMDDQTQAVFTVKSDYFPPDKLNLVNQDLPVGKVSIQQEGQGEKRTLTLRPLAPGRVTITSILTAPNGSSVTNPITAIILPRTPPTATIQSNAFQSDSSKMDFQLICGEDNGPIPFLVSKAGTPPEQLNVRFEPGTLRSEQDLKIRMETNKQGDNMLVNLWFSPRMGMPGADTIQLIATDPLQHKATNSLNIHFKNLPVISSLGMTLLWVPGLPGTEGASLGGGWVGKYEVTQKEFSAVLHANPSANKGENFPVESMTFEDATKFCDELTKTDQAQHRIRPGWRYALPSEEQWEHFARDPRWERIAQDPLMDRNNYTNYAVIIKSHATSTAVVGGDRTPNLLGLYDVLGNVRELTTGFRKADGGQGQLQHICRGGGFRSTGNELDRNILPKPEDKVTAPGDWIASPFNQVEVGFRIILIPAK